jgi:signal transduction histidine kinase/CheY-like chemotaxis protein
MVDKEQSMEELEEIL